MRDAGAQDVTMSDKNQVPYNDGIMYLCFYAWLADCLVELGSNVTLKNSFLSKWCVVPSWPALENLKTPQRKRACLISAATWKWNKEALFQHTNKHTSSCFSTRRSTHHHVSANEQAHIIVFQHTNKQLITFPGVFHLPALSNPHHICLRK